MDTQRNPNALARRGFLKCTLGSLATVGSGAWGYITPAIAQSGTDEKALQQASETILADWPEKQREVAKQLILTYGLPNGGTTAALLIWRHNNPWKYTVLHRQEVPHNFPVQHLDCLEQVLSYRVPPEKFDELATYNGSATVSRTKGEIAVMCDQEAMNFLSLNIAHDLITGKIQVEEARELHTRTAIAFMKGEKPLYTQALQFRLPQDDLEDPDQVTVRKQ